MNKIPIALQLYSIREEVEKDFIRTMQEVSNMGYDGVELAGLYGHTPKEVSDILKENGLLAVSAHVPYQEIMEDVTGTIRSYAAIGCSYVVIPYLNEQERYGSDSYEELLKNIPAIAKACKEEGITLLYHNHDFEFEKTIEGDYVLDALFQAFTGELEVELDTCWVKYAGIDPAEYMKKYEGRLPVVHLKDYTGTEPIEFCAVGQGMQNFPAILQQAIIGGSKWLVVEQDSHTKYTALEDARSSREYLAGLGY